MNELASESLSVRRVMSSFLDNSQQFFGESVLCEQRDDSMASSDAFPPFLRDDLDELNSVRFRVNEKLMRKSRMQLHDISVPSCPSLPSSSSEDSDSSDGDFQNSDGEIFSASAGSASSMSDPLSSDDSNSDSDDSNAEKRQAAP